MSEDKAKSATARSATEYRLSIGSAPTSRRSSIGESSSMAKFTGQEGLTGSTGECSENAIQQVLLPKIRELSDSIITLDSNFTHLNFIHESLADLNESLGSLSVSYTHLDVYKRQRQKYTSSSWYIYIYFFFPSIFLYFV